MEGAADERDWTIWCSVQFSWEWHVQQRIHDRTRWQLASCPGLLNGIACESTYCLPKCVALTWR
jgi:hypothetical protein